MTSTDRNEEVKSLPVQDAIWFVEEKILTDSESLTGIKKCVKVTDKNGSLLGCTSSYEGTQDCYAVEQLICHCALHPEYHKPRKPKMVVHKIPSNLSLEVNLDEYGIYVYKPGLPFQDLYCDVKWVECYSCHFRAEEKLFDLCTSCQGVYYCSTECRDKDWVGVQNPVYAHKELCDYMKACMLEVKELTKLPFTFTSDIMSSDTTEEKYKDFLHHHQLYGKGLWKWETSTDFTDNSASGDYVLPSESAILSTEIRQEGLDSITDWSSYYRHRGLDLTSPIALLLHWPLTVWFIIKHCLKTDYDVTLDSQEINIHVIGVEKEVMIMSVFEELGKLLPDKVVNISMFGRNFPKKFHGIKRNFSNVTVHVQRKLYHKAAFSVDPTLIIGFNAGIAAYQSWMKTLRKISDKKYPAYFTDYCHLTIHLSRKIVQENMNLQLTDSVINPFRCPLRKTVSDDRLPRCSNAFLFHMIHTEEMGVT